MRAYTLYIGRYLSNAQLYIIYIYIYMYNIRRMHVWTVVSVSTPAVNDLYTENPTKERTRR